MYECKILADSLSPAGKRLTTYQLSFPRFILAEVATHRMLSMSSASSRAIPVAKQLSRVLNDPFIPESWPTEQKGMSGGEPLIGEDVEIARSNWLGARDDAVDAARNLVADGVHKSLVNRLLEPFQFHTVLLTGTEWSNFFALRTAENAQPEFRKIALMMKELYHEYEPDPLEYGDWHLPLIHETEFTEDWDYWKKISVGRCARVSYLTHDGRRDLDADIMLADTLMKNGHMKPYEHVARPLDAIEIENYCHWLGNFRGWHQYRADIPNQHDFSLVNV